MCIEYKILVIICCVSYTCTLQEQFSKSQNSDVVQEIQHAVCNISTKDIQTSANASVTRQLRGVCTSKQLDVRLRQLELKIIKELEIIKRIISTEKHIVNMRPSIPSDIPESSNYESYSNSKIKDYEDIDEIQPIFSKFESTHYRNFGRNDLSNISPILIIDEKPTERSKMKNQDKMDSALSFPQNASYDENIMSEDKIRKLNNTVQSSRNGSVFYYFWNIENFNKLISRSEMYIRSPTLMVHGHELMIQFHPNQPKRNFITIKLKTSYSFQKKHTFSILHRRGIQKDIESPLLGIINQPNVFVVPLMLIYSTGCLINDSIILTLTIFLEMN